MNRFYGIVVAVALLYMEIVPAMGQALLPPANLKVQLGVNGSAFLSWDPAGPDLLYKVHKSIGTREFVVAAVVPVTRFGDWAIDPTAVYRYYVTSATPVDESAPGDTVAFRAVAPPHIVRGFIKGRVTDEATHAGLAGVVVELFKPGVTSHPLVVFADTLGSYVAGLDTGTYLVCFKKFGYLPEWYNNVLRVSEATPVQVLNADTTTADAELQSLPPLHPIILSGTVRDSSTGFPLPGTLVAFIRPSRDMRWLQMMTRLFGGFPSERVPVPGLGHLFGVLGFAFTDSDGNYEAHVPGSLPALAIAIKPGYLHKFYSNKWTVFDADRIISGGDSAGFDFKLIANPLANHLIQGSVEDSMGAGVPAHVVLYRVTPFGPKPVRSQMTDSLGVFEFSRVVAGDFLLRTLPVGGFAPAWYSASKCGVRNWHHADTVRVADSLHGVEICVRPVVMDGYCRITGTIYESGGLSHNVEPSQGCVVLAVESGNGRVIGFDITEGDGTYAIEGVPPGTYEIATDKEGYTASSAPVVSVGGITGAESSGVDIDVASDVALEADDVPDDIPSGFALKQNYPNPFNPTTDFEYTIPTSSSVSLKVYNLIGQEVTALTYGTYAPGQYSVQWNGTGRNGDSAGSGVYFVKLVAVPFDGSEIFSQVIKVVMLK